MTWVGLLGNMFINLPMSYLLGFWWGMGLEGFFLGLFCGNFVINVLYGVIVFTRDWEVIAERVSESLAK